ncbi:hypothetical protein EDB81DRAFT_757457 [Dactylonectria macrodidyma]|uniref:Uncharacterized protein n=1 Tax=Dactylonectria macrodidyma TaxID=307937 RepID=A0A9P9JE07_9HYPO|nr:hypothetical protein EDB81DRAFT_757457 [Dactylonectria macrodidyma]
MAAKPTRGWDATSHADLLLAFIEECNPGKAIITSVTERLTMKGYSYSFDAVNQHVQKLRRTRDTAGFEAAIGGKGSAASTPRKTATPRKRATPAKSKAIVSPEDDEDEDDKQKLKKEINSDDEQPTTPKRPTKRAKKTPKPEPVSDAEIEDVEVAAEI